MRKLCPITLSLKPHQARQKGKRRRAAWVEFIAFLIAFSLTKGKQSQSGSQHPHSEACGEVKSKMAEVEFSDPKAET